MQALHSTAPARAGAPARIAWLLVWSDHLRRVWYFAGEVSAPIEAGYGRGAVLGWSLDRTEAVRFDSHAAAVAARRQLSNPRNIAVVLEG